MTLLLIIISAYGTNNLGHLGTAVQNPNIQANNTAKALAILTECCLLIYNGYYDAIHWRSDLMTHVGQKSAFCLIGRISVLCKNIGKHRIALMYICRVDRL